MNLAASRKQCWSQVFLWVFLIYSTLYVVRPICEFLKSHTPFYILTNIFMAILLFSLFIFSLSKIHMKRRSSFLILLFIVSLYAGGLKIIQIPEEKLHFVEYGILGFLTYRAIALDVKGYAVYGLSLLLTSVLGWIDEGIQYFLPNRYYQTKDVLLNCVSAGLALLWVYVFKRGDCLISQKQENR